MSRAGTELSVSARAPHEQNVAVALERQCLVTRFLDAPIGTALAGKRLRIVVEANIIQVSLPLPEFFEFLGVGFRQPLPVAVVGNRNCGSVRQRCSLSKTRAVKMLVYQLQGVQLAQDFDFEDV